MMKSMSWVVSLAVVLCLCPSPVVATENGATERLGQEELRQVLTSLYQDLQTNAMYLNLREQVRRAPGDEATVERFLDFLPLSPLEMLRIDMEFGRYEIMVPTEVMALHRDWIRRNVDVARRWYGDDTVDRALDEMAPIVRSRTKAAQAKPGPPKPQP